MSLPDSSAVRCPIETERVSCNLCGRSDGTVVAEGVDHEYGTLPGTTFRFVCCPCGLMYLDPRPATSALDVIYPRTYYAYQIARARASSSTERRSRFQEFLYRRAIDRLRGFVDMVRASRPAGALAVLDVGCGDGAILDRWRAAFGKDVRTCGLEMDETAASIARTRGHEIYTRRIEEADLPADCFDLVCSFHVIEHVADPTEFLRKVRDTLRSTGYALIETPNIDAIERKIFAKRHWGGYHFPRHWNLYNPATFRVMAERAGLRVVNVNHVPATTFWVWTMHSLLWSRWPRLADRLFPPVDIFLHGSFWNNMLMAGFTAVELANRAIFHRTGAMQVLLRKA